MAGEVENNKADGWTKVTAAVKGISTAASNSYFFISLLGTAFNSQNTSGEEEMQYWEMALGIAIGTAVTVGDTYSDYIINLMNQSFHWVSGEEEITANISLSKNQKLALGCDAVAGAINIAASFAMVANTASMALQGKPLDRTWKAATLLSSAALGFLASVSSVRATKTNMERYNLQEAILQEERKGLLPLQAP